MSDAVAIVIPTLDEATTLPRLARLLAARDPPPDGMADMVIVDAGDRDGRDAARDHVAHMLLGHDVAGGLHANAWPSSPQRSRMPASTG